MRPTETQAGLPAALLPGKHGQIISWHLKDGVRLDIRDGTGSFVTSVRLGRTPASE